MTSARHLSLSVGGLLLACALLKPVPALAYEDTLTVGLEVGAGAVLIDDTDLPRAGALLGVEASLGLDDIWSVRGHLGWAWHPGEDDMHVGLIGAEILYLVDIVQLVPFFGAGVDGLFTLYQGGGGLDLGAHVVLGLEYLLSRELMVAFEVRPHVLPLSIEDARLDPVYLTANARVSMRFDL